MSEVSTKPYLLRAIHEWCSDSGYTPYIAVSVDERTQVPADFVRGGEIVLNISLSATNRLSIGNELIEFQARFGGTARELSIPIENVSAIYARENGHGMAFDVAKQPSEAPLDPAAISAAIEQAGTEAVADDADELATESEEIARPSLAAVPKSDLAASDDADSDPDPQTPDPEGSSPGTGKRRGKPTLTRVK
jgi:stringent starvation protein B